MKCFFHSASTGIFIEYDKNKNLKFVNTRMISISEKRPVEVAAVESKSKAKIIVRLFVDVVTVLVASCLRCIIALCFGVLEVFKIL